MMWQCGARFGSSRSISSCASIIRIARSPFKIGRGVRHQGDIAQATAHLRPLARVETTLVVKRGKQGRPKKQPVPVGTRRLPTACELLDECAPQRTRQAGHARGVAGAGARAGSGLGALAALHRLAGHRCRQCRAHLYHVSPTLECGGRFQISENLPGLGRGATAQSAGASAPWSL